MIAVPCWHAPQHRGAGGHGGVQGLRRADLREARAREDGELTTSCISMTASWPGLTRRSTSLVMLGSKTWMPGIKPGMTLNTPGRQSVRYIDAFNHFFPKRYYEALLETPAAEKDLGKRVRGIPALSDIDLRLKHRRAVPELHAGALARPAADGAAVAGRTSRRRWRRSAMTALQEVAAKHPKHFVGWSALLPMNAPDAAAKEAERVLKNGANAIQLGTNANGEPLDEKKFWPIYEIIAKSGRPILLHPSRTREMPDYPTEKVSKYEICSVLGWPYETGVTLARFVFSEHHRPQSGPEDHRAPSRRRDPLSRRPRRPQLRPAGRAHLGRGLRRAAARA